jgi:hypothetical protein
MRFLSLRTSFAQDTRTWSVAGVIAGGPRYVDEARLSDPWKRFVRSAILFAAILLSTGFFLAILSPTVIASNRMIYLGFVGAVLLAAGLIVLGIGLLRISGD